MESKEGSVKGEHVNGKDGDLGLKVDCVLNVLENCEESLNIEILNAKHVCLTDEDIASIVEIECHTKVQEWLYDSFNLGHKEELREYQTFFRKKLSGNNNADILIAKCGGQVVGFLGLWRLGAYMDHVATIGVSVHPDYWGKDVATHLIESAIELAKEKEIGRLEVGTLSENASMRRVAEKVGFKLESIRKNRIKKGGSYHDEVAYAMLL